MLKDKEHGMPAFIAGMTPVFIDKCSSTRDVTPAVSHLVFVSSRWVFQQTASVEA
ncbi:MAG: hypothetical protein ABTQ34_05880 [Bdellovibrionales bacterium]